MAHSDITREWLQDYGFHVSGAARWQRRQSGATEIRVDFDAEGVQECGVSIVLSLHPTTADVLHLIEMGVRKSQELCTEI